MIDPIAAAAVVDELASRLNRCGPSRRDPERFHVERNEIVVQLRRLAKSMRGAAPARKTLAEKRGEMAASLPPRRRS